MNFHFTLVSSNAKVGPILVTTSDRKTCPDSCGFKSNGCYAEAGHIRRHWDMVSAGARGQGFEAMLGAIRMQAKGALWRHNQAGDLPGKNGIIFADMLAMIVQANKGKRGFTYTHYDVKVEQNRQAVRQSNKKGFCINLSADSLDHADKLKAMNIGPVVVVLPIDQKDKLKTPGGNDVVICPAVKYDNINCANCGLCAKIDRKSIVGFPAHGPQKRKVEIFLQSNPKGL